MASVLINGWTIDVVAIAAVADTFKVTAAPPDGKTPASFLGWVRKRPACWEYRAAVLPGPLAWTPAEGRHKAVAALFALHRNLSSASPPTKTTRATCPRCGQDVYVVAEADKPPLAVNAALVPVLTEDGRRVRGRVYHTVTCAGC